ncbi:MAG: hypothetical protein ACRYGM_06345 [Janthinobacterium lividum]|jgi:hypothetical protein
MTMKKTNVELDANEVALIVGEEDGSMTVRVVPATELEDGATDVPEPYEIAVALAMRLLNDPDFHDDVLEWYESQEDEDGEEEDEDGEEPIPGEAPTDKAGKPGDKSGV